MFSSRIDHFSLESTVTCFDLRRILREQGCSVLFMSWSTETGEEDGVGLCFFFAVINTYKKQLKEGRLRQIKKTNY